MFQANQVFQKRKDKHQKKEVLGDKTSFFEEIFLFKEFLLLYLVGFFISTFLLLFCLLYLFFIKIAFRGRFYSKYIDKNIILFIF